MTKASAGNSSIVDRITSHRNQAMISIALLALLGIMAVASGRYWKKYKSGLIDSIAVLPPLQSFRRPAETALGSTEDPTAYQLYLKGKHYTSKFTRDGFDKGIDYLNQAIAIDPNYTLAYSALAFNYINQVD